MNAVGSSEQTGQGMSQPAVDVVPSLTTGRPAVFHLFTTMDVTSDRAPDLMRLIATVERYRQSASAVQVSMYLLLQRCSDLGAARAALALPSWVQAWSCSDLIPLSVARNRLIKPVLDATMVNDTDIVAFPDDDCFYPDGLLAGVAQAMGNGTDFWFCRYGPEPVFLADAAAVTPSVQTLVSHASSNTIFVSGAVLRTTSGFDETLGLGTAARGGEDTDFALRAFAAARQTKYVPATMIGHRAYNPALRGKYYPGALAAIARNVRGPAATLVLLRKLAVGGALLVRRELSVKDAMLAARISLRRT